MHVRVFDLESLFKLVHNTALFRNTGALKDKSAIENAATVFPFFPSFELVQACNTNERLAAPFEKRYEESCCVLILTKKRPNRGTRIEEW